MQYDSSSLHDKLRVRVCGLLVENESILLAQLHSPVVDKLVWTPPGGGLQFGEEMEACLQREFTEETKLEVQTGNLLHVNQLINLPFHTIEFYFEVQKTGGELELGRDPELSWDHQLLNDLQWIKISKLSQVDFVPASLMPKITNWERRKEYPVYKR